MTTGARLGGGFLALTALGGVALSASGPAGEAPTKAERGGLALLHRHAVKLFIDRTGFGLARMEPPLTDVLGPPKSQGDSSSVRSVGPTSAAIRADTDGKASHFSFAKAVGTAAFIPPPVPGKVWVVKDVQLVGLVKHPEPVVYLTGGVSMARENKDTKTRQPDPFEAQALEVIRGGGELIQAEKRGGTLRAVSGIYAGKQCSKCHERPGEMLGAFTYRLALEDPPAKGTGFGAGFPLEP